MDLETGDRVRHPKMTDWGIGEVLGVGVDGKIRIYFANGGEKTLKGVALELVSGVDANDPTLVVPEKLPLTRARILRAHRPTQKTPQHEFRDPILRALDRRGGEGPRIPILEEIEQMIGSALSDYDKADLHSGAIRWQKSAEWEVRKMRMEGVLKPVGQTETGFWSLTKQGFELARSLR